MSWVVHYGNYYPREVASTHATEAEATADADRRNQRDPVADWRVEEWPEVKATPPATDPFAHLSRAPTTPSADVVDFILWVDRLLDDEDCQYAATTLTELRTSAKGRDAVTDAMREAVANIEAGGRRGRETRRGGRSGSRRYEGFGDGSRRRW